MQGSMHIADDTDLKELRTSDKTHDVNSQLTHSWQNRFGDRPVEKTSRLSPLKLMLHSRLNICSFS
jgi:hypothetical protein